MQNVCYRPLCMLLEGYQKCENPNAKSSKLYHHCLRKMKRNYVIEANTRFLQIVIISSTCSFSKDASHQLATSNGQNGKKGVTQLKCISNHNEAKVKNENLLHVSPHYILATKRPLSYQPSPHHTVLDSPLRQGICLLSQDDLGEGF